MILRYYIESGTNPYENLAMERCLAESVRDGEIILYLWQNRHTVVIGRNQNAWRECRTTELERDGGFLARRLSGGGAVYHDLGNLCFTFCVKTRDYDLRRQQSVIVEACRSLGIPAEISGRNDVLTGGAKFSGNSFYSHEDYSFHNGTLLLNVDMDHLGRYLNPSTAKLRSKGVASVRSRVVNLCDLKPDLTITEMEAAMVAAFERVYDGKAEQLNKSQLDPARLQKLTEEFSAWEWNYGFKRPCTFTCEAKFPWGEITLDFLVENGVCREVTVYSDAMDAEFVLPLREALLGSRFDVEELCRRVHSISLSAEITGDLCHLLREQDI